MDRAVFLRRIIKRHEDVATLIKKGERQTFIDILKVIALVLMIVTHVIAIATDYSANNQVISYIGLIGGIGSFSTFLFMSGMNAFYFFDHHLDENQLHYFKSLFVRVVKIFIAFIILSIVYLVIFNKLYLETYPIQSLFKNLYDSLTVGPMPEFSEYLIAIAIFTGGGIFFSKIYKWISKSIVRAIFVGGILYTLSWILFRTVTLPARLNVFAAILWGKTFDGLRIHSFPVLQYSILFFLGLAFARYYKNNPETLSKLKLSAIAVISSITLTGVALIIYNFYAISTFYPLPLEGRFPPSLGFLFLSSIIVFISLIVAILIATKVPSRIRKICEFMGKRSLSILVWHLILLFGYRLLIQKGIITSQPRDIGGILLLSIAIIFLSVLISWVYTLFVTRVVEGSLKKESYFLIHTIFPITLMILSLLGIMMLIYSRFTLYAGNIPDNISNFKRVILLPEQDPFWANDDYKVKQQITLENKTSNIALQGTFVSFTFDHSKAVAEKNALSPSGNDIRIYYWNVKINAFEELPILIESPNTANTKITFILQSDLLANEQNTNYYLYYGNWEMKEPEKLTVPENTLTFSGNLSLSGEVVHKIALSLSREWLLLKPETKELLDTLSANINLPENLSADKYFLSFTLFNSEGNIVQTKDVDVTTTTTYTISPDIAGLGPSLYTLQAQLIKFDNNLEVITSYKTPFRITYPMYVTWSFDWDGWDASDYDLYKINDVANRYTIPVTQLFNPRIYVADQFSANGFIGRVSTERATYLTNWVLNRHNQFGDEIGMHLHMFSDMVTEAGVSPRPGRVVGAMYGDAMTSDFTETELEKIMNWGFGKFEEHGLPRPITYRAGGWFASPQVLQAAQNTGFLIDSSGRTGGTINPTSAYSTQVPWNLLSTTWPYKPNVNDMNRWDGDRTSIFEFPDNGADSYWFTAEQLINRFQDNMKITTNGVLMHPQVLTYLTHPHWFTIIDEPKVRNLFDYVSQFKYNDNSGPVIFTTLEKAYQDWDKINDVNGS
ncbi:MAG: acyltransferase family protein [Candidatus Dojkabacteria bacterium]